MKTGIVLCTGTFYIFSYKDIFPFDYNRVPVFPYKISGDSEPSDYINASFVSDVFSGAPRKYIAAQVRITQLVMFTMKSSLMFSNHISISNKSGHVFRHLSKIFTFFRDKNIF